jgi:hypothetical protein
MQHAEIPGDGLGIAADDEYIDVMMGRKGHGVLHGHVNLLNLPSDGESAGNGLPGCCQELL